VPAEYQNRRLKTVFYFKDGRQIKNLSWPILSPTSTRPPQEVHPSADVAEVLHKQLENIEIALEELKLARKEFETIKEIPKKLEKLEKLRVELDQVSSSQSAREDHLEAFRLEVMEQRKQNELTRIRQRDELEREWDQFQIEKTAFIEDSDLSAKVLLLNEVISEMEAAWDVFAKANQLKVRLSLQSLAQIRELVAQPLEQARQAQIRRLNTIGPKVSVCPICGSPTAASNRCRNRCFEED
jgi:hypothetical protein